MHVLFTTVQISPSTRLISAIRDSPETKIDTVEVDLSSGEPWTEIHRPALEQSPNTGFADPDCADWT